MWINKGLELCRASGRGYLRLLSLHLPRSFISSPNIFSSSSVWMAGHHCFWISWPWFDTQSQTDFFLSTLPLVSGANCSWPHLDHVSIPVSPGASAPICCSWGLRSLLQPHLRPIFHWFSWFPYRCISWEHSPVNLPHATVHDLSIYFQSKTLTLQTLGTYRISGVSIKGCGCSPVRKVLPWRAMELQTPFPTLATVRLRKEHWKEAWEALGSATGELCGWASLLTPLAQSFQMQIKEFPAQQG